MSTEYLRSLTVNAQAAEAVRAQMTEGLIGLQEEAGLITDALFAGQHVELIGPPGVGKTELTKNLGLLVTRDATPYTINTRLQGASDRQPADFLGSEVYNQKTGEFETRKGPIFGHIVLADEINRNNTKTQAALHEAMAEGHVTIGTEKLELPRPFMVVATLNSHEFGQGTNVMSDALLDRFGVSIQFNPPTVEQYSAVATAFTKASHLQQPKPVLSMPEILRIQGEVATIPVEEKAIKLASVFLDSLNKVPEAELVSNGFRAIHSIIRMAQANAMREGNPIATTEQVRKVIPATILHRIKSFRDSTDEAEIRTLVDEVMAQASR